MASVNTPRTVNTDRTDRANRTHDTAARPHDVTRQIAVISAVVFMIIAAMVGTGLFGGTNVRDLQGGALAEDATYLAPDVPAFSIWSVIYILMVAYAIYQALPGQRSRPRQRLTGWWIALTAVLNGVWLLVAQFSTLVLTAVGIVVLLIALGWTLHLLVASPPANAADMIFMDVTVGLHLGWVTLATVANITAVLTQTLPTSMEENANAWGIAVLIVVGLIGLAVAWFTGGRLAPGLASAWGLVWIAVARTTGSPESSAIAVTASIVAVVIVVAPIVLILSPRPGRGVFTRA